MKTVIFARVSTAIQDYDRQVNDLTALADRNGWSVEAVFAEKVSGAKKNAERKELQRMVEFVETHSIDKILVSELSRIGRNTLEVLKTIEMLNAKGISLYLLNYNIETLTEDNKINPMSQFLITLLAEVARMERSTIKERMVSGYDNFRANGGKVGRKEGFRKSDEAMKAEYAEELRLLRKGISLRNVAKLTKTSVNTLRKVKALIG